MFREFNEYVNSFDLSDDRVVFKIEHSIRVYEKMEEYAKRLGYSADEIKTAGEIGLLHDIGRFYQLKSEDAFDDKKLDHADYSIKYLFEKNNIKRYVKERSHYEAIEHAIKYHNKYELPKHENPQVMKLSKLIRDVDKIDILYCCGTLGNYEINADNSKISKKVMDSIINHQTVNINDVKTNNDEIAMNFALCFDINNDMCIKEIRKNLKGFYKRVNSSKFKEIYDICDKYLEERLK